MTRVLLINTGLPTMLAEIIGRSLAGYADVQLLTAVTPAGGLVDAVRDCGASVVVGAESELAGKGVSSLLQELPRSRVFTLAADARMAWLYELRPERVALGEVSPERLVEAIRTVGPCTVGDA